MENINDETPFVLLHTIIDMKGCIITLNNKEHFRFKLCFLFSFKNRHVMIARIFIINRFVEMKQIKNMSNPLF